jgi:glucosamine-6-phosphate deaminase
MDDIALIPRDKLGQGSPLKLEIVDTEDDIYYDIVRVMLNQVKRNEAAGKPTCFILPVGPVGQYRRLARLCNLEHISLRNVIIINMDEYCDKNGQLLPREHPLSFRGFMDAEFYELLDDALNVRPENRIFPDPSDLDNVPRTIARAGGVDLCIGGIGINGHLAFNEPPEAEEEVDLEEFASRPTRLLKLSRETVTINSHTATKGNLRAVPPMAVTVGMKEILGSRECRFYCNRPWQPAVARYALHGPVTPRFPASYLQRHPHASLVIVGFVAEPARPQLR